MDQPLENAIAVIGLAGRFPGAENIKTFWSNILQGKESISAFTSEDLIAAGISEEKIQSPHYVKARGIIENVEFFDADFFGILPHEAQLTDPQQRLFLECAFEALENACYSSDTYKGTIGVYGGTGRSTYFLHNIYPHHDLMEKNGNYLIRIGNEPDFLTTKVSHRLNLKGPSLSIQTACSTSLVAVCIACNHLLTYQCDIALAGGASIYLPQVSGYVHQEGMIFSQDGHCKPFDREAQGTVPSNGVGIVALKRLEDAIADRDNIYAIIRGYGLNNDGGEKLSYSAPSANGQATAIESAIAMAEVDPSTISYAETHGTATFLGDPIEIDALTRAFRQFTDEQGFCAIGSVKSNIGHSMEAAGIAGFIKAVLSLHEKKLPPTLHFNSLNPHIDSKNSPFYVNTELKDWPLDKIPRRACVSSFGIGGTNAHVILEESPTRPSSPDSNTSYLLILSAKTPLALNTIAHNLSSHLELNPTISMSDVSFSLQTGRKEYSHRRVIMCRNREEAIDSLLVFEDVIPSPQTSQEKQLADVASSWLSGIPIDWASFWGSVEKQPSRIPLPTYPFEKKRHWIEPPSNSAISQVRPMEQSAIPPLNLETIWKQFLGVEKVGPNENFFSIGGDSLLAIQVITQIEKDLGISISLQTFYQFPTLSQLSFALSQQLKNVSSLVSLKKGSEEGCVPLFFIHGIDGNIFPYKQLAESLDFQGAIFGIQGDNSDHLDKKIEEIASSYISEIQKVQKEGPYLLCGSSFGGIIAYEMANQLEQRGDRIGFLGIIDAINPQCNLIPRNNEWEMLAFLSELIEGKETSVAALQNLPSHLLADKLLAGMGLSQLPVKQRQNIFQGIQTRLKSLKRYDPNRYKGDVVFFQAKERFFRMRAIPLALTWQPLISGKIQIYDVDGSHLSMLKPPHLSNLSNLLNRSLKETQKKRTE